ncbi:helix-turn-helix domain-containing protein [Litoribacillus peritrichatus]|uniref:Helix-turn-helix transcriptional regulator n=1 Tax=Litoribacillus peritrichatus TaxID=718191 RepID=A0ABP7MVC5_9GAMM
MSKVKVKMPDLNFPKHLRYWRGLSKLSQMELALACDLSPKHLNQLENNKANPTRQTVLNLAKTLNLSFKNTNGMLTAAGFTPEYRASNLFSKELSFTHHAIQRIIDQHNPFPAIVTDPGGNFLMMNTGAIGLMQFLINPQLLGKTQNAYEVYFSELGFRPHIVNWEETSREILLHLQQEVLAIPPGEPGYDLITRLERDYQLPENWRETAQSDENNAIFNFHFCKDGINLKFFSTFTTFGTPRDVAIQDVRIESFFPADEDTQQFCEQLNPMP